ncbi:RNA-binding protein 28 [Chelonus insularis]|uniref:RNA-binding protein 28 n=1 Tax=Chelonus insularis TaxID=460826 RepID=UPI00158BE813|nr:RNA-binding protein 28 [Chelonus insularis]
MVKDTRRDRNKLSWVYRHKKKQGTIKKPNNKICDDQKTRIIVKNLSFQATEEDVRQLYEPFGKIEKIDIPKRADGKIVGCAFIQFEKFEDASKAIFKTNKQEFLGRPITSAWAISKLKYTQKLQDTKDSLNNNNESKDIDSQNGENNSVIDDNTHIEDDQSSEKLKKLKTKLNPEEKKALKLKKKFKRARIVVRNLSFQATEQNIRDHFSQYGNIAEIKMLKKDGKLTGCAFIQFDDVQSAAKAIHHSNMKVICNRPIVVDPAVPKNKFIQNTESIEIKKEPEDPTEITIKEEKEDEIDEGFNNEEVGENGCVSDVANDSSEDDKENSSDSDEENSSDNDGENDSDNDSENKDDVKDIKLIKHENNQEIKEEKRPRVISHDVREGKTIFLKNVPFSAKNDDIKVCMEQFGPVHYALVCMDPLTEHSKGTAFVKFRNIEDAEKCLTAESSLLRLQDQILEPHRALDKNEVSNKNQSSNNRIKDSRNLYLVKEGVIVAGTPAAVGVSATDMKKRLQLEQWKSQMLKNLNMFVSRIRLVVHNLPENVDDAMLRKIFKKYSGPKAIIQEARVMRDMKRIDSRGFGVSKGHGFVSFTTHEDALKALRNINNNPKIFSKAMRPIVAFSIENKVIVNVKKRRIEKSRERNPLWRKKYGLDDMNDSKKSIESAPKRMKNNPDNTNKDDTQIPQFSGLTSKPGKSGKLRSTYKLKTQAVLHNKIRKNERRVEKNMKINKAEKKNRSNSEKVIKPKRKNNKINKDDVNFNNLVDKYKNKLKVTPSKSKWYET